MKNTFSRLSGRFVVVAILILSAVAAVFALAPSSQVLAASPTTLNFQGKVVNANGTNVTNNTYPFVFRIYNTPTPTTTTACSSDATCLFEETQSSVTVTSGVFQVELGSGCSGGLVGSNACTKSVAGGLNFNSNNALYLVLKFNNDAAGFMNNPIHLTSVPYAFYADNAGALGGIAASGFIQSLTSVQSANIAVQAATSGTVTALLQGNASGTADILDLKTGANVVAASFTSNGFFNLTPANMLAGQTDISQTITNASTSGGTVQGLSQTITVNNSTVPSTTLAINIGLTDNTAGSLANTATGITISLAGTNNSRSDIGVDSSVGRGLGVRGISGGLPGATAYRCNGISNIGAGVCAGDTGGLNTTLGLYAYSGGRATTTLFDPQGTGAYGINNAAGQISSFYAGVKGISSQTATAAYTSIGVLGQGKAGSTATAYGGYFTLDSTSGATLGSALYASNSTIGANILQLQDNTTSVVTVADGGAATFQNSTNSAAGFQIQNVAGSGLFIADTIAGQLNLTRSVSSGNILASTASSINSTSDVSTSIDATASPDDSGQTNSIAIGSDGLPAVAYYQTANASTNVTLKYIHCGNSACSSGNNAVTVDNVTSAKVGTQISMAIGSDGLPIIAYYDLTNTDLRIVHCGNVLCSTGNVLSNVDSGSVRNSTVSITIGRDGFAAIGYQVSTNNGALAYAKCNNITCSTSTSGTVIDDSSTDDVGNFAAISIAPDGLPTIGYVDDTLGAVRIAHCGNTACSSGNTTNTLDTGTGANKRSYVSQKIGQDGLPIVSYHDVDALDLKVTHCGNTACSSGNTTTSIDTTNSVGQYSSIAVGPDGLPIISEKYTTGNDLRFVKCTNILCSTSTSRTITTASAGDGYSNQVVIGTDGLPITTDYDASTGAGDLVVYRCSDAACDGSATNILSGGINIGASGNGFQSIYVQSIRTTDAVNPLTFATNNIDRVSIDGVGNTTFKNTSSTTAFQIQNSAGQNVLGVDTSGGRVLIGNAGSGVNGTLVFNNSTNANTVSIISGATAASGGSGYSLTLPTTGGSGTQCLQSTSGSTVGATVLTFGACAGGGATLSSSYNTSATTGNTITVTSAGGAVVIKDAASTIGTVFNVQNGGGSSLLNVDGTAGGNITLLGNSSGDLPAWSTNTGNPLPLERREAATVYANGYVYVMGGWNTASAYQSTIYYAKVNTDGSIGTWNTSGVTLPVPLRDEKAAFANGYIYVTGGATTGGTLQTATYYAKVNSDGSINAWQNGSALTSAVWKHSMLAVNGYLYVMGGNNGTTDQSTTFYIKLNGDGSMASASWTSGTALQAGAGRADATTAYSNGYIYMVGGSNTTTAQYATLNPITGALGTWSTSGATALGAGIKTSGSVIVNGYIYLVGGFVSAAQQTIVQYAPIGPGTIGAWSNAANGLPLAREQAGVFTANGYIYDVGGFDGTAADTTIYYTSTSRLKVGGNLDLVGLGGDNLADASGGGGSLSAANGTFTGTLNVQDQANFGGSVSIAHELNVSGSAQFMNASNLALFGINTTNTKVSVGSNTTDTTQVLTQFDSFSTFADTASCSLTSNQGAVYYNTTSNAIRGCVNNAWEDMVSTGSLGLQLFGIVPDSGTAGTGDIAGVTGLANGPCKVSNGTATNIVAWKDCVAFSGGRKVIVAAGNITATNSTINNFQHLCLTGTNSQPALSTSAGEAANLATVSMPSVASPILCLADIKFAAANNTITSIYNTGVYTTTTKEFATAITTAPVLGQLVKTGTTTPGSVTATTVAAETKVIGVVVASTGATSTNSINVIVALNGPAWVKAITGTNAVGDFIQPTATAGYGNTAAFTSVSGYLVLGIARTAWTGGTACSVSALTCSGSILTNITPR